MDVTIGAGRSRRSENDAAAHSHQLARTCRSEGRIKEAETLAQEALRQARSDRERASIHATLAEIRLDRGKLKEARRDALALLDWAAEAGDLSEQVRALCLCGRSYLYSAEPLEARPFLERALAVTSCLGEADAERSAVLTLFGDVCRKGGHFYEAEESYREALHEAERHFDPHHAELAIICLRLAMLAESSDESETLEPFARRAYSIRCSQFGSTHPLTAAAQTGLALVLEAMGNSDEAGEKLLHALAIFDRHFATGHCELPVGADTLQDYATCRRYAVMHLVQAGRGADAREFSERAVDALEGMLGKDHPIARQAAKEHASLRGRAVRRKTKLRYSAWEWWRTLSFRPNQFDNLVGR